jgi:hypothetical protein
VRRSLPLNSLPNVPRRRWWWSSCAHARAQRGARTCRRRVRGAQWRRGGSGAGRPGSTENRHLAPGHRRTRTMLKRHLQHRARTAAGPRTRARQRADTDSGAARRRRFRSRLLHVQRHVLLAPLRWPLALALRWTQRPLSLVPGPAPNEHRRPAAATAPPNIPARRQPFPRLPALQTRASRPCRAARTQVFQPSQLPREGRLPLAVVRRLALLARRRGKAATAPGWFLRQTAGPRRYRPQFPPQG